MRRTGAIGIPDRKNKGKYITCKTEVRCFDQADSRGLEGGKIDYLRVRMNGEDIAEYSGGWLLEPTCEEAEMAVAILMYEHN